MMESDAITAMMNLVTICDRVECIRNGGEFAIIATMDGTSETIETIEHAYDYYDEAIMGMWLTPAEYANETERAAQ